CHNCIYGRNIVKLQAAAQRVGEELFGEAAAKIHVALFGENFTEAADVFEGFAGDEFTGGIDRLAAFRLAPGAEGIKILQGEAERIHAGMAGTAERGAAM